ncbi:DUF3267 domain-containing protein [Domibacillus indicus]|uniref:DUF3267 domain-containing protein n=1 Tax=Domibacillus indicus TaxID=1437523 RepID=UPI000617E452|nr:DUF3267 domain-containing protein [Domibacillus indicus]
MYPPHNPDQVITLNIKRIHIYAILLTFVFVVIGIFAAVLVHEESSFSFSIRGILLWAVLYILLIVLHEAFHLIGFMIWGKCKKNDLVYGINRELGVAYAGTKKVLPVSAMKKALLLPFWVTGMLPFIAGIWLNSTVLIVTSAFLIGGAAGDFSMYRQLRRAKKGSFVLDHLHEPVLYVFNKKVDSPY